MMNPTLTTMRYFLLSLTAFLVISLSSCSRNGDTKEKRIGKEDTQTETALGTIIENMQSQLPIDCGGGLYLNAIERDANQVRFVCLLDDKKVDFNGFAASLQASQESFLTTLRSSDESIDLLCLAVKEVRKNLVFRFKSMNELTYFDLTYPSIKL